MKEKILNLLCRKVNLMGETYTIGGIIVVFAGIIEFVIIMGLIEGLGE